MIACLKLGPPTTTICKSIGDKLEETQILVTDQKKVCSLCYICSCAFCVSELRARQWSACSQPIGTERFPCPTCTTALVIHQWEAKLAIESILITWVS